MKGLAQIEAKVTTRVKLKNKVESMQRMARVKLEHKGESMARRTVKGKGGEDG